VSDDQSELHEWLYGPVIAAQEAYHLIDSVGLREVAVHPAVDEITLKDGRVLRHWEGGYEHDREWTLETGSGR
jgi:hypothetical protein